MVQYNQQVVLLPREEKADLHWIQEEVAEDSSSRSHYFHSSVLHLPMEAGLVVTSEAGPPCP